MTDRIEKGEFEWDGKVHKSQDAAQKAQEIQKIAKALSLVLEKGVKKLKLGDEDNPPDKQLIDEFQSNLKAGFDPRTAAENAYQKVDAKAVSNEMNTVVTGLSGFTPPSLSTGTPFPYANKMNVNGTTVEEMNIPGYGECIFPVGGNGWTTCTSEALGMMMDYAVDSGNKTLFEGISNAYAYLASKGIGDGLIPWAYNVANGSVSIADQGSALDADLMAVGGMIKGMKEFGNITLGNGSSLQSVVNQSISGLTKDDIVSKGQWAGQWAPGNHWGGSSSVWSGNPYYDYVDFQNVQTIIDYCKGTAGMSADATKITDATNSYLTYELAHVNDIATNQGTPDGNASLVRVLTYLGNFLADSSDKSSPFYQNASKLLDGVMETALKDHTISVDSGGVTIFGDHNQFATIGAFMVALYGLKAAGYTELQGQPLDGFITQSEGILKTYLTNGDDGDKAINNLNNSINNHQTWSNGAYFDIMVFTKCWATIAANDKNLPA